MGFFSRIFNKKKATPIAVSKEQTEYDNLKEFMSSLLSCDHYVAKSEYSSRLLDFNNVIEYFNVLQNSEMLKTYCKNKKYSPEICINAFFFVPLCPNLENSGQCLA